MLRKGSDTARDKFEDRPHNEGNSPFSMKLDAQRTQRQNPIDETTNHKKDKPQNKAAASEREIAQVCPSDHDGLQTRQTLSYSF